MAATFPLRLPSLLRPMRPCGHSRISCLRFLAGSLNASGASAPPGRVRADLSLRQRRRTVKSAQSQTPSSSEESEYAILHKKGRSRGRREGGGQSREAELVGNLVVSSGTNHASMVNMVGGLPGVTSDRFHHVIQPLKVSPRRVIARSSAISRNAILHVIVGTGHRKAVMTTAWRASPWPELELYLSSGFHTRRKLLREGADKSKLRCMLTSYGASHREHARSSSADTLRIGRAAGGRPNNHTARDDCGCGSLPKGAKASQGFGLFCPWDVAVETESRILRACLGTKRRRGVN
ncbi:hypothetical protein QBC34DRAFT_23628 [Podospora aff. communis PSN243]|uniref:Uncharacterized protein n=1 Tax=Podospora aff. communis PSN243 TaxID=3040156 RepID=A0AAV9GX47_9PEZI|nr:hypothetical protein QBC34DRAFT_23628 [Podospora aff. communis PSN243]